MEILRLSSKDIKKLKEYELHEDIQNHESNIYFYKDNELLKLFKNREDIFLLNKFYVLNKLFYIKENIDFKELVFPNNLIKVSGKPSGYTMNLIRENTNVGRILNNNKISFEDKKFIIIKIGEILRKIEYNDMLVNMRFHLGDIHEYNFIYDNKENSLKVVDLDSSYVSGIDAPTSKFLTFNDKLWDFPNKYPIDVENDRHIPNLNTTIISYVYLILNTITNLYVPNLSISGFCNILNMLGTSGFNKELLDSFYNIYLPKDNYLDLELIKSITDKQYNKFKEIQLKKVKK